MKKVRRTAAFLFALAVGLIAWIAVMLCSRTEGELRLARELSTGRLIARVPAPNAPLLGIFKFDPPHLAVRFLKAPSKMAEAVPHDVISLAESKGDADGWYVNLDPLDKSWELEVTESRTVRLQLGGKAWRVGTQTRVWRTQRTEETSVISSTNRSEGAGGSI